jgi:hypothetical protein
VFDINPRVSQVTLGSFIFSFVGVLGLYWIAGYIVVAHRVEVSPALMCFCVMLHTLGVVIMMAADTQKYFVLKVKKGLIADGWFWNCRNPNYLVLGSLIYFLFRTV